MEEVTEGIPNYSVTEEFECSFAKEEIKIPVFWKYMQHMWYFLFLILKLLRELCRNDIYFAVRILIKKNKT